MCNSKIHGNKHLYVNARLMIHLPRMQGNMAVTSKGKSSMEDQARLFMHKGSYTIKPFAYRSHKNMVEILHI